MTIESAEVNPNLGNPGEPSFFGDVNVADIQYVLDNFRKARGIKKNDFADRMISLATRESFHVTYFPMVLDTSVECIFRGKQHEGEAGHRIIRGIDDYFKDIGINYRLLAPVRYVDNNLTVGIDTLTTAFGNVQQSYDGGRQFYPMLLPQSISKILKQVSSALKNAQFVEGDYFDNRLMIIHDEDRIRRDPNFIPLVHAHGLLMGRDMLAREYDPDAKVANKTDDMLDAIFEANKRQIRGVPDLLTAKFEGVSMQDVLEEKDIDECGYKLLHLLSSSPKGDMLWSFVIQNLFGMPASAILYKDENQPPKYPKIAEKITRLQMWMGEKLLMPVLEEGLRDQKFDSLLSDYLSKSDSVTANMMIRSMLLGAIYAPNYLECYYPDVSPEDLVSKSLVVSYAIENELLRSQPIDAIAYSSPLSESLFYYREKFVDNFGTRFEGEKLRLLNEAFMGGIINIYRFTHSMVVSNFFKSIDEELMSVFNEVGEGKIIDLFQLTKDCLEILSDIDEESNTNGLRVPEDSLISYLGIDLFGFFRYPNGHLAVEVLPKNKTFAVTATISPEDGDISFPVLGELEGIDELFPTLKKLVSFGIAGYLNANGVPGYGTEISGLTANNSSGKQETLEVETIVQNLADESQEIIDQLPDRRPQNQRRLQISPEVINEILAKLITL